VLIEGRERDISIGRSYRDAPEIDGLVFLEGRAPIGGIVSARITGAMPYDLTALPVNPVGSHSAKEALNVVARRVSP